MDLNVPKEAQAPICRGSWLGPEMGGSTRNKLHVDRRQRARAIVGPKNDQLGIKSWN